MTNCAKRILIVDDNYELLKLLELLFKRDGFDVVTADDGDAALEAFSSREFDLVLLDIMIPGPDGYEVCNHIRCELHSDIPVVMLSSLDSMLDEERSMDAGATDHVAKPFSKDELLALVRQYAGKSHAELCPPVQALPKHRRRTR